MKQICMNPTLHHLAAPLTNLAWYLNGFLWVLSYVCNSVTDSACLIFNILLHKWRPGHLFPVCPKPRKKLTNKQTNKTLKLCDILLMTRKNNVEVLTIDKQRKKPRSIPHGCSQVLQNNLWNWTQTQQDVNKLSLLSNTCFKKCQKFRLFNYSSFNMHASLPWLIKMHHFKSNCSRKLCFMLLQW